MYRNTVLTWVGVCAAAIAGCTGTPNTPVTPSATSDSVTFLNSDGSSIKASVATNLNPNGGTLDTRRPTLSFSNPSGRYVGVGFFYELEIQDAGSNVVYTRPVGDGGAGTTSHTVETELEYETTLWWRVRPRLAFENQIGPWSGFAQIRTPNRPLPPSPVAPPTIGGVGLQFPPPAACAGGGFACVAAVAALSDEWGACAAGSGVGCHRFSRQVVAALSAFDPNWQMIQAAPGGHACNCFVCGPSDGTMFREDTAIYGGRDVYDMIVGAGGPSPSLNWNFVGPPRNVDGPNNAPVCR